MGGYARGRPEVGSWRLWLALLLCGLLVSWPGLAAAQGSKTLLRQASSIAYDGAGDLYIADAAAHQVWEATLGGSLLLVAGTGVQGSAGDGGPAVGAQLNQPQGLAFGTDGTLYVADTGNHRVRMVSTAGTISTFAGTGVAGFGGDGGTPTAAQLRGPTALAVDGGGGVLICDTGNHRVRRVSSGVMKTIAGTGEQGFAGDGGLAAAAWLDSPAGVVVASDGRVFIADTHNERVRVVDVRGVISTFAGTGANGFAGDGGPSSAALLSSPRGLAWDGAGDLFIADEGNQRVREVNAAGVISTAAGSGVEGGSLDGAGALAVAIRAPRAVAVSSFGLPVFADRLNQTVREVVGKPGLYQPAALAPGRSTGVSAGVGQPITYGQSETATVTVSGAVGTPMGQVAFAHGGTAMGTASLGNGTTNVSLSGLDSGTQAVMATYLGDGLNPGASASFDVSVGAAVVTATASSSQAVYGAPLPQLTGVVSGLLAKDAGAVTVSFGVAADGAPQVGTYPILATLSGPKSKNYTVAMSSSSGSLEVVKAGTSAVLDNVGQSFTGMPMSLSATVAPSTSGQPTGTVQFLNGTTVVATAQLSGGSATASYLAPAAGVQDLSVQYLGDGDFLPSASPRVGVTVLTMPDFTLAPSGAQTASTSQGGVATYSVLVSSSPGPFTGAVSLSLTGLPDGAKVSFSPPLVVPGSSSATVTVSVQTAAAQTVATRRAPPRARDGGVVLVVSTLCWAGFFRRRRRVVVLFSLLGGIVFLCGCGARSVGEGAGGVLAETYTLQVTGTATNLAGKVVTHSTSLALTVQQ